MGHRKSEYHEETVSIGLEVEQVLWSAMCVCVVVCVRSLYDRKVQYFSYEIFLIAKQFQKCKYNAAVRKCTTMSNKDVVQR